MREWTREERYQVLESPEQIRGLHEAIRKSAWRQTYHVQPVTGLSSDPNGFAFHKGVWHLFYQWCPWGAVHGLKYWYHVTSPDLVHWKNEGVGLAPDTYYDNRGTHSGSAISDGEDLYFFYTGNHRDEDWTRTPYTCAAKLGADGKPVKREKPLFGPREDYAEHQRDPKIVWNAEKQRYYIFIGAQTLDGRGTVQLYSSKELFEGWTFEGQLHLVGYESFGGMWECPYIVSIGDKDLLIFSPQYTKLPGRGESTNHNVYFIGKMDYDTLTFTPEGGYHHLDHGFDFYAAQGAANVGDPDKAILIAWIGLPDNHYPSAEEDWEGSMSLPRELTIRDGHLFQYPVPGVKELRAEELPAGTPSADGRLVHGALPKAGEMQILCGGGDLKLHLFEDADGKGALEINYDDKAKILTVDKSGMKHRFNESVGERLEMPLLTPLKKLDLFIDHSSIELFANDGEETFTSHVYPEAEDTGYTLEGTAQVRLWRYNASVKDDFAV